VWNIEILDEHVDHTLTDMHRKIIRYEHYFGGKKRHLIITINQ